MLESVDVGKRAIDDYEATAGREEGAELSRRRREVVRERFLLTRLISDELGLYADLLGARHAHEGVR